MIFGAAIARIAKKIARILFTMSQNPATRLPASNLSVVAAANATTNHCHHHHHPPPPPANPQLWPPPPTTSTSAPPPLPHVTQTLTPVQNRGTAIASAWLSTWLAIDVASSLRTSNGRDVKCHCFGLAWFTCTTPLPPHPKRRHSATDAKEFGEARHARIDCRRCGG